MPQRPNPRTIYGGHSRLTGSLAPGAAVLNTIAVDQFLPVLGASRVRAHFKATVAGTLAISMADPTGDAVYADPAAVTVAVVANTDVRLDADPRGEAFVRLRFTPGADGAVTFCDFCAL